MRDDTPRVQRPPALRASRRRPARHGVRGRHAPVLAGGGRGRARGRWASSPWSRRCSARRWWRSPTSRTIAGSPGELPVIRSTCPVTNEWVRRFHPALAGALAPIVPPYIAQARLVKALYPKDTAVVYVSPCYARKDEALDEQFDGAVDVAIDFIELEAGVRSGESAHARRASVAGPRFAAAASPSRSSRSPTATRARRFTSRDMTSSDVQVVRGLADLDRVLSAIGAGEATPHIVDVLNCEGCIDGPAVNPGMSLFAKRNLESSERGDTPALVGLQPELLRHLPAVELSRAFSPKAGDRSGRERGAARRDPARRRLPGQARAPSTAGRADTPPAWSTRSPSSAETRRGRCASRCRDATSSAASRTSRSRPHWTRSRAVEPSRLLRSPARRDRASPALRHAGVAAHDRPRRLQADQRPSRPCGRRRGPGRGGRRPARARCA